MEVFVWAVECFVGLCVSVGLMVLALGLNR